MRFTGFIGPSYTSRSVNVDCQRCINLYPELDELGTGKEKEVASLVGTPGLLLLQTLGDGPIRGAYVASNLNLYIVSSDTLYLVGDDWSATSLGTLQSSSGPVSIADNGFQLVVVDGENGYYYDFNLEMFFNITDPAFPGADQVVFQDGYFIFNKPSSGQFFISGLNEVTFNALDFSSAEGNPDNIVGLLSDHRELWLFGSQTVEVFYNSGAEAFPFERISGAFVEHGCIAAFSVAKMNNTVYWLGADDKGKGIVFQARGYQPQRISTHAVENAIQNYGDISDAVAYTYQENGHFFYVLNFTNANTSWVFDSSTNLWHERAYTNNGTLQRHRANTHAFAYGVHVVGDYENGKIYKLSSDVYSDDGVCITRKRTSPHVSSSLDRVFYKEFQLDIESGTGLDGNGQGTDPQVILQFSDDGGHSWSNEKWCSFGKMGQRKARAHWHRLGMARDRVFSVTITDPVKVVLLGAEMDLVKGNS